MEKKGVRREQWGGGDRRGDFEFCRGKLETKKRGFGGAKGSMPRTRTQIDLC